MRGLSEPSAARFGIVQGASTSRRRSAGRASLKRTLLPALGGYRLTDLRRADVQLLVDQLAGDGLHASTIRNTLDPLRAIYRRAVARELVAVNPTNGLELPAAHG